MLNTSGHSRYRCLVPDFREKALSYLPIKYDISCGFFMDALYQVKDVSFCSWFPECLFHDRMLDFVKCSFCVNQDDLMAFVPCSVCCAD